MHVIMIFSGIKSSSHAQFSCISSYFSCMSLSHSQAYHTSFCISLSYAYHYHNLMHIIIIFHMHIIIIQKPMHTIYHILMDIVRIIIVHIISHAYSIVITEIGFNIRGIIVLQTYKCIWFYFIISICSHCGF